MAFSYRVIRIIAEHHSRCSGWVCPCDGLKPDQDIYAIVQIEGVRGNLDGWMCQRALLVEEDAILALSSMFAG